MVSCALALASLGGATVPAGASCAALPVAFAQGLADAPVVFVGTVTGTSDGDRTATVHVDEQWRGTALPAEVTLHGSPDVAAVATSVDRHYRSGQRYLFVPAGSGGPPFDDNSCSLTSEYTQALATYRPASARVYPPAPAAVPIPLVAGGLVVLALATGAGVALRRRGRLRTI